MHSILFINGANLNLLGAVDPKIYGSKTLDVLSDLLRSQAAKLSIDVDFYQSNAEYKIINRIHAALEDQTEFIIINASSFASTSLAICDALSSVKLPYIELHIENIFAESSKRPTSLLSKNALGIISGLGTHGYELALQAAHHYLQAEIN